MNKLLGGRTPDIPLNAPSAFAKDSLSNMARPMKTMRAHAPLSAPDAFASAAPLQVLQPSAAAAPAPIAAPFAFDFGAPASMSQMAAPPPAPVSRAPTAAPTAFDFAPLQQNPVAPKAAARAPTAAPTAFGSAPQQPAASAAAVARAPVAAPAAFFSTQVPQQHAAPAPRAVAPLAARAAFGDAVLTGAVERSNNLRRTSATLEPQAARAAFGDDLVGSVLTGAVERSNNLRRTSATLEPQAARAAFGDAAFDGSLAEQANNMRPTSPMFRMEAAPHAFGDSLAERANNPLPTSPRLSMQVAPRAFGGDTAFGSGSVQEHSKRLRFDSADYSAMAGPSAFGDFDSHSPDVPLSPRAHSPVRQSTTSAFARAGAAGADSLKEHALSRTTAAAASDEALAFQHATSMAFNLFHAPATSDAQLIDVEQSRSAPTAAAPSGGGGVGASAADVAQSELQRDSEALARRIVLAARTLLAWKHQSVDVVAHAAVPPPTSQRAAAVAAASAAASAAAPYAPGTAARLVAAVATLTDEAGDLVLSDSLGSDDPLVLATNERAGGLTDDSDREVRLFVSSTFVDMNSERDVLMRHVFPSLHAFCVARGVRLLPMDLRWGITEEQSRQGSTIDICLREIDRARPYFLCLLGSRYGWAQPYDEQAERDPLLEATVERAARSYAWVARYADRSVTELEVRHAVLNVVAPDADMKQQRAYDLATASASHFDTEAAVAERALFFLRDDVSAGAMDKRLHRLRDEIAQLGRTGRLRHVVRYTGDDSRASTLDDIDGDEAAAPAAAGGRAALAKSMLLDSDGESDGESDADAAAGAAAATGDAVADGLASLGRECAERLKAILSADFPLRSVPSSFEAEATAHRALVARLSRGFVARQSLLAAIDAVASNETAESVLFVTGGEGMGKSCLLANWWRRWRVTHGATDAAGAVATGPFVLAHLSAASAASAQLAPTLLRLTEELGRAFGLVEVDTPAVESDSGGEAAAAADDADDEFDKNSGDDLPQSDAFARSIGSGAGDDGGTGSAMRVERLAAVFAERLRAAAARAGAGIVLLIDGIELLSDAEDPLHWLPMPLPEGVRLLVGARTVPPRWRGVARLLAVPPLTPAQTALVCARRLAEFGKTLSSAQLDALAACEAMRVPRFARIVADELRLLGDFDHLDARLARYLQHRDTAQLRQFVLARLAREFAQPPGRDGLLANVFACLLCVPQGLREAELVAASRCPPLTWSSLSTALQGGELLVRRGELLAFADAGVAAVARAMCDKRTLDDAHARLERHYGRIAARELRAHLADPATAREQERRARLGLPPPVATTALLVRALRQRLTLLVDAHKLVPLEEALREPATFDVLWHARGADSHAARFDLFRFWRAVRDGARDASGASALGDAFLARLAAETSAAIALLRAHSESAQREQRQAARGSVGADGFVLGVLDVADRGSIDNLKLVAAARGAVMDLFRRASAFARFAREAVSAAAAQRASAIAVELAEALKVGRRGEGRYVTALAALAYSQRLSGQLHEAAALYRRALVIAERLAGNGHDMRLAQLINALAICLRQLGQYKDAELFYARALDIRVTHFGELSVDVAQSHNSIGCLHQDLGNYDRSEYHLLRAIELRERLMGAQHPDVAMSRCNLGGLKLAMGKMDEAEREYRRAMAIYAAAYGERHSGTAQCINALAGLAAERRRDAEARRLYAQALEIRRAVLGAEHPDVAVTLNDMAVMLVREGEHADAEPLYREALRIRRKVLGANHIDTGASLQNLGLLLADLEQFAEAEASMLEALRVTEATLGAGHVDLGGCWRSLAGLAQKQQQFERAIEYYTKALTIFRERVGELHVDFALTCNDMAVLYMRINNPSAAVPLYEDALKAYVHHFGKEHADVALATLNLAECVATQALQRGAAGGALALLHRCAVLFKQARERFVNVREGAVSGAGASGITREQRIAHIDRTLGRVEQKIKEVEANTK